MLEEIGRELREARESLGLELGDIQKKTKIRSKYLIALEEGDGDSLPAPVYARGILRRYCQEVGIDSGPLMDSLVQWQDDRDDAPLVDGLFRTPGTGKITLRPAKRARSARAWILAAMMAVVLLSAGAVYYFIILPQADMPPETPPAAEEPPNGEEAPAEEDPEEQPEEDPDEDPTIVEPSLAVTRETGPGFQDITYHIEGTEEINILLEGRGLCWIRVHVDGEFAEELTVEAGSSREWTAVSAMRIRAGNPAALMLTVNGVQMGVPDDTGPRNLLFSLPD